MFDVGSLNYKRSQPQTSNIKHQTSNIKHQTPTPSLLFLPHFHFRKKSRQQHDHRSGQGDIYTVQSLRAIIVIAGPKEDITFHHISQCKGCNKKIASLGPHFGQQHEYQYQ